MNWLLIVVLLIVAGNMVWGFEKGLFRVLYSLIGWIVILALATVLSPQVGLWLQSCTPIHGDGESRVAAFFLSLVVVKILLTVLVRILDLFTRLPFLDQVNRFLGILAGLMKGVFLIQLFFWGIALFQKTEAGQMLIRLIYASPVLAWFYENNLVKDLISTFL